MLNHKILFTFVLLLTFLHIHGMSNEEKYNILSLSPGNVNVVTIDGISHAIPVDLFDGDNNLMPLPYYTRGVQETGTSELCRKSKNASANLTWFKAKPNDYGQLKCNS